MMRWARNRADDELPDAVVRMYWESLDDDGLEFLRRGPRTAAERLAYAQRVHPEAYRTAEPAPASAQAHFAQRGSLDQRRHFVGPDRNLYLRGETTAEPLHSSIRRGFETAVPGFRSASLEEALSETERLTSGNGWAASTASASSDQLADTGTMPVGWSPWHEAGPLRMNEIASWAETAAPAEVVGMDQRERVDVLRYLRFLDGEGELSERLSGIAKHIASDPIVQDALTRWIGGNRWSTSTPDERGRVLEHIVERLSAELDLDAPAFRYYPMEGMAGRFTADTNELELSSIPSSDTKPEYLALGGMSVAGHEVWHAWQDDLRKRWVSGMINADHPDYALSELAALSYPFFIPLGSVEEDQYNAQLLERWANFVRGRLYNGLSDLRPPVLERPPG